MQTVPTVSLFIIYPDLLYARGRDCRQDFDGRRSVSDAVNLTLGIDSEAIVSSYRVDNLRVRGYLPGGIA
jgi:hypothetical protein